MPDEHYFSPRPASPAGPRQVEFVLAGRAYRLVSASGVFSAERLDPGTSVLLRKAPLPGPDTAAALLDLGCGYGPVTIVLAVLAERATVYAVDVNARARELTERNTREHGVADRVVVAGPDDVPEAVRFAQIWSNPPIRVGKAELHAMLDRWLPRLTDDGVAWLVVARNLGGDTLQAWLTDRGWCVDRYASQKGYRVLRVSRAPGPAGNSGDSARPRLQNP